MVECREITEKPPVAGEKANDVLGQPVAEIVVLRVVGHVAKRYHRDRRSRDGLRLHRLRDDVTEAGHFGSNRDAACHDGPARRAPAGPPHRSWARSMASNIADEAEAALVQRPDHGLVAAVVAQAHAGRH